MADLVHVRPRKGKGGDTYVGREWLKRWPEDFEVIDPIDPAPVREETPVASAATTAPTGEKEKKK